MGTAIDYEGIIDNDIPFTRLGDVGDKNLVFRLWRWRWTFKSRAFSKRLMASVMCI